jgi:TP901 family phage tail tape measure protein
MAAFVLDANLRIANVLGLEQVKQKIAGITGTTGVGGAGGAGGAVGVGGGAQAATAQAVAGTAALTSAINKLTAANQNLATSAEKANRSIRKTNKATEEGSRSAQNFGQQIRFAGKRYLAFVTATAVPFAAIGLFRGATQSVIEFDAAVTKVRQITGQTTEEIAGLKQEFLDLSIATGTSATELANSAKVLAQAGIRGQDLRDVMQQVSKVPLTPTFGSINAAIEGLLAISNQYNIELSRTEEIYDVLTQVGNEFAASAEDLFQAFARGGAAFKTIGGNFKEFAAVAAVVRQETRESASSVGTFLKTISTRLADSRILEFLRGKGIELLGPTGQFIGPIEALRTISERLQNIVNIQDKVEIAVKIAGRRQVSRLLAAVNAIDEIDRGLNEANNSAGAFSRIAEEGLKTVEKQIAILVAELNNLFQTLAEPVIIPLIQGFTTAAKAVIGFVDALSPVIPLFAELIAAAIGIKALTLAMRSLGGAAAKVAAVEFTGLAGLSGVGAAGVAERQRVLARAAGGTGQGIGAAAGTGAAIAAAGKKITSTAGALVKSHLGQLAAVGALTVGLDHFGDKLEEAGKSSSALALQALEAAGTFALFASLISGKGALALFATPVGAISAAAVALGAGILSAGQQAREVMEAIGKETAEKIKQIEVDIGDTESLQSAGQAFIGAIADHINQTASQFRDAATQEQTFQQFFAQTGERLKGLFTGERGFFDPTISQEQIRKDISKLFENNAKFLDAILHENIAAFGSNFQEGIENYFKEIFLGFGKTPEEAEALAKEFTNIAVKVAGQEKIMSATINQGVVKRAASEKLMNDTLQKKAAELFSIRIPTQISFELQALSDAVRRTVQNVDVNAQLFDTLASSIGRIPAPQLELDVTELDIQNLLAAGGVGKILGPQFEGLGAVTSYTTEVQEALKDLLRVFTSGEASAELRNQISRGGGAPTQLLSRTMNEFVEGFIDLRELPPDVAAAVRASGQRFINLVGKTADFDPEKMDEAFEEILKKKIDIADVVSEEIGALIQAEIVQLNDNIKRRAALLEVETERTFPEDVAESIRRLSAELDIPLATGIDNTTRAVEIAATKFGSLPGILDGAISTTDEYAQAVARLVDPANLADFKQNAQAVEDLADRAGKFQAVITLIVKALEQQRAALDPTVETSFGTQPNPLIERFDETINFLTQRLKETQTEIAAATKILPRDEDKKPIQVFESATDIFSKSVDSYKEATNKIVNALLREVTPEETAIPKSAAGVLEARITNAGEISPNVQLNRQDLEFIRRETFGTADLRGLAAEYNKALVNELDIRKPLAQDVESVRRELAGQFAAGVVEPQVVTGAIDEAAADRITKNLIDLLLGEIPRLQERVLPETFDQAFTFAEARFAETQSAAEQSRASAEVSRLEADRAENAANQVSILGDRPGIQQTGGPAIFGENITQRDIDAINAAYERRGQLQPEAVAPQVQVPEEVDAPETVRQLELLRKENLDTSNQLIGLQQQNLNAQRSTSDQVSQAFDPRALDFVVPGASTALTAGVLGAVEPTAIQPAEAITDSESATKIAQSAEQLASASNATEIASANLDLTTDAFQLSVDGFNTSVQTFANTINQISAIPNIAQEAQIEQPIQDTILSDELIAANRENTEVLRSVIENLQLLSQGITQRTEQVQEEQPVKIDDIEIKGLDDANQATNQNTDALSENVVGMSDLANQLALTEQALAEGTRVELNAVQQLILDIQGLDESVEELKPEFTEVAVKAAKLVVKQALIDLADKLSNAELSTTVNSIANNV